VNDHDPGPRDDPPPDPVPPDDVPPHDPVPPDDVPPHDPAAADDALVPELDALLEAVLLVADQPVPAATLAQVVEHPVDDVQERLVALSHAYAQRGSGADLRQVGGGWRFYTRADCAPWVERFVRDGQQARLTQAALETLAVVAYRQPVSRARVSAVRGVNVDGVVRTLLSRGLLAEQGADPATGATLYVTTPLLLEKLGIDSLAELPSLAPLLPELEELDEDAMST
jgi:segregation and condensation protein B